MSTVAICRDPDFWQRVASHPAVAQAVGHITPHDIGLLCLRPNILPFAAEHGGFLFARLDVMGFTAEVHTLFTPEGWGREAVKAGIEALGAVFTLGFQTIVTWEVAGNPRSKAPRRMGWVQAGDWRSTPIGEARQWVLTRHAFEASPVWRPPSHLQ
jgi:hypothetical protein